MAQRDTLLDVDAGLDANGGAGAMVSAPLPVPSAVAVRSPAPLQLLKPPGSPPSSVTFAFPFVQTPSTSVPNTPAPPGPWSFSFSHWKVAAIFEKASPANIAFTPPRVSDSPTGRRHRDNDDSDDEDHITLEHPLEPSQVRSEVEVPPTPGWKRTTLALLGSPFGVYVPHHVTNLGTELQAEAAATLEKKQTWNLVCEDPSGKVEPIEPNTVLRFGAEGSWGKGWRSAYAKDFIPKQSSRGLTTHKDDEKKVSVPMSLTGGPVQWKTFKLHGVEPPEGTSRVLQQLKSGIDHFAAYVDFAMEMLTSSMLKTNDWFSPDQFRAYVMVLKAAMLANPGQPALLSKVRGRAGESLYLWALLMEEWGHAQWLLELEPMLFKTRYARSEYKGENAIHVIASKKIQAAGEKVAVLRKLAKSVLFYTPPDRPSSETLKDPDLAKTHGPNLEGLASFLLKHWAPNAACEEAPDLGFEVFCKLEAFKNALDGQKKEGKPPPKASIALPAQLTSALCWLSWKLILRFGLQGVIDSKKKHELVTVTEAVTGGIHGFFDTDAPLAPSKLATKLCRQWMRSAWVRNVNGLAYGSFFEPDFLGGSAYYGGTPLSIATVMGDVDTIRFLTMEVGCTDEESWVECGKKGGAMHLYPDTLDAQETREGDAESRRFHFSQIKAWDHRSCARLDCTDRFGNTPAHMAVSAHATTDMFNYLQSLYKDGFGRCNRYYADFAAKKPAAKQPASDPPNVCASQFKLCVVAVPVSESSVLYSDDERAKKAMENALSATIRGLLPSLPREVLVKTGEASGRGLRFELSCSGQINKAGADAFARTLDEKFYPTDAHTSLKASVSAQVVYNVPVEGAKETVNIGLSLGGHASVIAAVRCALRPPDVILPCTSLAHMSCTSPLCRVGSGGSGSGSGGGGGGSGGGGGGGGSCGSPWPRACGCEPLINEVDLAAGDGQGQTAFAGWRRPTGWPVKRSKKGATAGAGGDGSGDALPEQPAGAGDDGSGDALPEQLMDLVNRNGYTPFTLAARLGKRDMFEEMWKSIRQKQWSWGGVNCYTLSLEQVDDIGQVLDEPGVEQHVAARRKAQLANGGLQSNSCVLRVRGWVSAVFSWWLPLPWSHFTCRRLPRVPPSALFITVKHSINEMLDAELSNRGSAEASTSRSLLAGLLAESTMRRVLETDRNADPEFVAKKLSDSHADAANLIDLARAPSATEGVPLLQLLAHRKWDRMYKLRFLKLAIVRGASLIALWVLLLWRYSFPDGSAQAKSLAGVVLAGAGLVFTVHLLREIFFRWLYFPEHGVWGFCRCRPRPDPGKAAEKNLSAFANAAADVATRRYRIDKNMEQLERGRERASTLESTVELVRAQVAEDEGDLSDLERKKETAKIAALEAVHNWQDPPPHCQLRRCLRPRRENVGQASPSLLAPREAQLYASAHDGVFGRLYLFTLLCGSFLLTLGAALDLGGGWAWSGMLYSFGGFFSAFHMMYFLLGWEGTGTLVVMFGTLIWGEFFKWLGLFIPTLVAYGFFFQLMSATVNTGSVGTNIEAFLKFFLLFSFDNSLNTQSSMGGLGDVPASRAHEFGDPTSYNVKLNHVLFVIVFIVFLFFSTVALISLLVGQMSWVLNTQGFTRKSDFLLERLRAMLLLDSMTTRARDRNPLRLEDRYWVCPKPEEKRKEDGRPAFHWQAHSKYTWINDDGKNLARESAKPAAWRLQPVF